MFNYTRIIVYSNGSLPLGKTLTLYNVIALIKSDPNKNQNHYCYNIFLERCSYQIAKK